MSIITNKRNQTIDFLRTIAVALTLFRHFGIDVFLYKIGWIGVDLFFVLSGFLVSGLLFNEYKKTERINFVRFVVRRGLKIYPLFYLLLVAFLVETKINPSLTLSIPLFIAEALFYKNYVGGNIFLVHTWSIDVEEHFYLSLPLVLLLLVQVNKKAKNPFKALPLLFILVAIACLAMRIYTNHIHPTFEHITHVSPTHLRIDSLFFGTLLSYFYNFHFEALKAFITNNQKLILIGSALCLLPALILWDKNLFMLTGGFTLVYLAFGGILLVGIFSAYEVPAFLVPIYQFSAHIGLYSYATYILHWPLYCWFIYPNIAYYDTHYSVRLVAFIIYFITCFGMGWLFSKTIEIPFLALRDKLFPSTSKAL